MAYTTTYAVIDKITVKVANGSRGSGVVGDSQTVNVYDVSNTAGNYRQVYRSRERSNWVTASQIERDVPTLNHLDGYLIGRGFAREGPRRRH